MVSNAQRNQCQCLSPLGAHVKMRYGCVPFDLTVVDPSVAIEPSLVAPLNLICDNGRCSSHYPLDATPWAAGTTTSGPSTPTTRAPSVLGGSGLGPDTPYSSSLPAIVYTEASLARRATDPGNSSEATAAWVARRRRACACVSWVGSPRSPLPLILHPPVHLPPILPPRQVDTPPLPGDGSRELERGDGRVGGATTPGLCVPVEFRSHYLQKRAVLFKKERKHCALRAIQPRQHCALNQVGTLIASARDRDRAIALRVIIYIRLE